MKNLLFVTAALGYAYEPIDENLTNNTSQEKYFLTIYQKVRYNKEYVKYFRFQPISEKVNYHGERISLILAGKKLLGFARFHKRDMASTQQRLPSVEESKKIALAFIHQVAPELTQNMKILWVKPHDEYIKLEHKEICLTGMKVKCRELNTGLYFWVIIGVNKQIMAFERDIQWITFPGKRATEKWLDDTWALENKPF